MTTRLGLFVSLQWWELCNRGLGWGSVILWRGGWAQKVLIHLQQWSSFQLKREGGRMFRLTPMTVLGEELLASYLLVFQYIIYIMRDTSLSRVSDIELGSLLVRELLWSLDLTRVFLWGGECNGDVRRIRLTVGDVSKALVFWGVIGLSNRGWKFISLMIAKVDEISIWNKYN